MINYIASPVGLCILFSLFGAGLVGALAATTRDTFANIWTHTLAVAGSLWGLLFAGSVLATGNVVAIKIATTLFPWFAVSLKVDALAAFFIIVISIVTLFASLYGFGYVREYYKKYSIGALGFFYNTFILGMLLVVTAANGLWFLVAWEIMSLASYFLVVYDRKNQQNVRAGYIYLVMTHVGAACILFAMLLLAHFTHSFEFDAIKASIGAVPVVVLGTVFGLTFVGLGIKAGIIPLHIWLPSAHPAAPSHVSALMSGVMIKVGVYMMIRLFLDILQPIPVWWGVIVLIVGALSSVLGVLYALTQHDIKRLLAYHSIENIGIILLGVGSAMIFSSLGNTALMLLSLGAALFHTLNHAIFKSLLFLSAGSVVQATHTRNIEKYGGLLKYMPLTGLFFLVGSMAISALPPFNGFYSEWLTFQSLFSGLHDSGGTHWVFLFAAGSLAVTGGLALACFVKVFGATFLARPRSDEAKHAKESSLSMRIGMAGLALLCVAVGLGSSIVSSQLMNIARNVTTEGSVSLTSASTSYELRVGEDTVVAPLLVGALLAGVSVAVWLVVRYVVYHRQKVTIGETWDCGTQLSGRMEITASGFAWSIVRMFHSVLRPTLSMRTEPGNSARAYLPASRTVLMHTRDLYQIYLYQPAYTGLMSLSRWAKYIQNGNLNTYILYILIIVMLMLGVN
jgi:hydrogenase-4 component B